MCTLIAIHRHVPGASLLVAANRDEYLDRPATGPNFLTHANGTRILAPRDLRAGGTWLGLNEKGVFAALTNRPTTAPDTTRRSRGLLVMDALGYASAAKAAGAFESLRADQYNPFNLFIADANDAFTLVSNAGAVRLTTLEPGAHVIGNAEPNDIEHEKTQRTLDGARALLGRSGDDMLDGLAALCRSHEGNDSADRGPLGATCVHTDVYGTRSAMLLRLEEDPAKSQLHWADGAPCVQPFEDSTHLLQELSRLASYDEAGSTTRTVS
ncbi:MAG: NRDE family protein [Myxococcota bacterium]|nr:NRDE family protein [Myxococcota bacterium]